MSSRGFADALTEGQSTLKSIGLGGNDITAVGARSICKSLAANVHLESLGLGGNSIGPEGSEYVSEMLKVNTTLKKLVLSSNQIDDFGLKVLTDGVVANKTLTVLVCFHIYPILDHKTTQSPTCSCWPVTSSAAKLRTTSGASCHARTPRSK